MARVRGNGGGKLETTVLEQLKKCEKGKKKKNGRADKVLPRQNKAKRLHHHQAIITWNVKGTYLRKRRSKLWT